MVNNLSAPKNLPALRLAGFSYLVLFFLHLSGNASDQVISFFSSSSRTFSLGYLRSSFSRYVKYSQGFSWFAFALSTMLYRRALAEAPRTESMMCQECFPTQKLLMLISASLLSRGIKASRKYTRRYTQIAKKFFILFDVLSCKKPEKNRVSTGELLCDHRCDHKTKRQSLIPGNQV